jgi:K(+)-stimulated pyrophosphate-energized sodium pump
MIDTALIPPAFGIVGLIFAFIFYRLVLRYDEGPENIKKIADAIHEGAMIFMRREYTMLAMFGSALLVILYFALGTDTALAFIVGAFSSALAGWIGMYTATKANVRTTTAAHTHGAAQALSVAFFGGSIMGLTVASMGLLGLGLLYYLFGGDPETAHHIHGFGMGASTVALFSRVGGGIFTKSADVGADLVGKLEAGIPEDDPRNPGVIADNVGDNVGDVAGMGSDIFESYCGAMIASIAIASTLALTTLTRLAPDLDEPAGRAALMSLPLVLASTGLICSLLGILLVRLMSAKEPAVALRFGTMGAPVVFIIAAYFVIGQVGLEPAVWWSVVSGAVGGMIIGLVTEYYTSSKPIVRIAESGETGPATVMITGLAVGMQSPRGSLWGRYRRPRHAGHSGHHHGHRCLWAGGRQCRRHRRDGRPGRRYPGYHRLPGRARQYHRCHGQRLCHRRRSAGGAGHHRSLRGNHFLPGSQLQSAPRRPRGIDRLVHRRPDSISHRVHHHDLGRRGSHGNDSGD